MASKRTDPDRGGRPPARYPGVFRAAVSRVLAELGWKVQDWLGDGVRCLDADGQESTFGLENLYRRAKEIDRADWPDLIRHFVAHTQEGVEAAEATEDLDAIANRLLVRLRAPGRREDVEKRMWGQPLGDTGLVVHLVVDSPESMTFVNGDRVEQSGQPGSAWLERALANLRARTPADYLQPLGEGTGILLGNCQDAYDAVRALILDDLLPDPDDTGWLVAVPTRDSLLVQPVRAELLSQMHLLRVLAVRSCADRPYPITDEVFWVRGGRWLPFPVELGDEQVTLSPPEEFLEVLNRLMPEEEGEEAE